MICGCGCTSSSTCLTHAKKRYTVEKPPRVYEMAIAMGMDSKSMRDYLWQFYDLSGLRSASSRVPLSVALRVIQERWAVKG